MSDTAETTVTPYRGRFAGKHIRRALQWRNGGNPRKPGSHGFNAYELIPHGNQGILAEDLLDGISRLPAKSSKEYGAGGTNHIIWDLQHGFTELLDNGVVIPYPAAGKNPLRAPHRPESRAEALHSMREVFLSRLPNFTDFTDPDGLYAERERRHKDELVSIVAAELPASLFEYMSQGDGQAITDRIQAVLTRKLAATGEPQNLVGWRDLEFIHSLTPSEASEFSHAAGQLMYGAGEPAARAAAFVERIRPIWVRTVPRSFNGLSRTLTSCLLMLSDPSRNIAIRTRVTNRVLKRLTGQTLPREPLTRQQYQTILDLAEGVLGELQRWAWRPRDLMDVQGFFWVAGKKGYGVEQLEDDPSEDDIE